MAVKPSKKTEIISSFLVMDIMELAQELETKGRDVIHLEVGQPDFNTPSPIREAGIRAIRRGKTKYTHSLGVAELRYEIAHHYKKDYGVEVDPSQVIVANGSSSALFLTLSALINNGDNIVLGNPYYSCYPNYIKFMGGRPVYVPLKESEGFQIDPKEFKRKINSRTKAILINSPSNPTGAVLEPEVMEKTARLGKIIVSDEIYHGLTYGTRARSILEFTDNAFVVGGFSKRYAMTGWRIGYLVGPKKFIRPMQKVQQNFQISPSSIAQEAAIAALKKGKSEANRMKMEFNKRRKAMIKGLREIGFEVNHEPKGGFYVFVSCAFLDKNSYRLAVKILKKTGVAVTPGIDFGSRGEGYLRFSYTTSLAKINEGIKRLGRFIKSA